MKLRTTLVIAALIASVDAAQAATPAVDWSNRAIQCTSPDTEQHAKDAIAPILKMIYMPDPAESKMLGVTEVL